MVASPEALSGTLLSGRYRLGTMLGAGGSGAVYRALDVELDRQVAVKLVHKSGSAGGSGGFLAEAAAASRVNHPNAIAIYEVGTWEDLPYLVMEEARGVSLAELLATDPLPAERACAIAIQVLDALAAAHDCGVVHCDLSGDNVIIDGSGDLDRVKVIDFGLARLVSELGERRLVGTAEYLAPEQIRQQTIGPAVDIYAAGVLLYEMVVGRTPYAGTSAEVVINGHLYATPTPPHQWLASCPEDLGRLITRALDKDPDRRPPSARAMKDELSRIASGHGAPRPRVPVQSKSAPLVGRQAELESLQSFLLDHSGALHLVGPEGIGKKRLLSEAAAAVAPDVTVLTAPGVDEPAPWAPILELLRQILEIDRPTVASLQRSLARLGLPDRDVPGIADLFGVGPGRDLDRDALRREALASAMRAVASVARRLPRTAVAFTDLHRFDLPSRELALTLASSAAERGLAVVITSENAPGEGAGVIELQPLSLAQTRELLGELISDRVADAGGVGTGTASMAAGPPARVEQLAGWLADGRSLADAPSSLVDLISQRILQQSPRHRQLIQSVAALGGDASAADLGIDDPGSASSIPALLEVDADAGRLRLHSPLITRVAAACTPADVRKRLHRGAQERLGGRATPLVRARHAELCEDHEVAYSMYTKAGLDAFGRFDDRGAAYCYGRAAAAARALHRAGYPDAARRFVAATIFAAEALLDGGELKLAEGFLDEAELFAPSAKQLAAIERARGLAWIHGGRVHDGRERLERAISAGLASGDLELVCDAYLELAETLAGDHRERAVSELHQAIDVTTGGVGWSNARAPKRLWRVGHRLAELLAAEGRLDDARRVAREALAHARRRSSRNGQARLAALMAGICERAGDLGSALRYRARAIKELQALGDRRSTAELLLAAGTGPGPNRGAVDLASTLAEEIGWVEGVAAGGKSRHDRDE